MGFYLPIYHSVLLRASKGLLGKGGLPRRLFSIPRHRTIDKLTNSRAFCRNNNNNDNNNDNKNDNNNLKSCAMLALKKGNEYNLGSNFFLSYEVEELGL